jgi:hypothetical protein
MDERRSPSAGGLNRPAVREAEMSLELDHLFVWSSPGGAEADQLVAFGLSEGTPNRHPGQGTANRRFFFCNAFLELLWVEDAAEAQAEPAARLMLCDRWSRHGRGASSFGICMRPRRGSGAGPPFATWPYRPAYLPAPLSIEMGANCERCEEPLLFLLSFGRRPDSDEAPRRQPLAHAAGLRSITRLRIAGPPRPRSSAELRAVELACPWLSIAAGGEDLAEVGFDGEIAGHSRDFRPALPLVFHW